MKVDSIAVENVRSFKEREVIHFNDGFNIIIGPNGGGKSNLLDITSVTLNDYFLDSHSVQDSGDRNRINVNSNSNNVDNMLEKNLDRREDDSVIEISLKVSNEDIQNMKNIHENIEELRDSYSEYENNHAINNKFNHVDEWVDSGTVNDLSTGDVIEYTIINGERETPQSTAETRYVQYLTSLDLFILLSDDLDSIDLQPVYFYFPPYRGGGTEDKEVSITPDNYYQQLHQYVNSTSREQASAIQLAQFKLASLMRSYEVGKGSESEFDEEQEVKLIKDNFRKLVLNGIWT
jgi:putative ATP-dependent endonuclease of OLD family